MATNLQIKFIKSLQLKKNRQEHRQFVCEGDKMLRELIQSKEESIIQIYATEKWVKVNSFQHPKLVIVSSSEIDRMSSLVESPEVLALVAYLESTSEEASRGLNLFLDGISDPGNMGTILRTAEWFGLNTIYVSTNSVDIYNHKVVQASMGAIFRVSIVTIDFESLISQHQFTSILAAVMNGKSLKSFRPQGRSLLVMGSESHGISSGILSHCTDLVTIPNLGRGESLNVSVATGIILNTYLGE